MHFEFLVEEESMEETLYNLIPKIVGSTVTFKVHTFQGKEDLLSKLPDRLKGYVHWLPSDWIIVALVDEDREDCKLLKDRLEEAARINSLNTRSHVQKNQRYAVLNRIVVEELEAWFFGDVVALRSVYPRISRNLNKKAKYRNPDAIQGGTWETLERLLRRAGYHLSGLPKVEVARKISALMKPDNNISKSFQIFADGIREMGVKH
jgi:Domain of unknown function (DUF4276)